MSVKIGLIGDIHASAEPLRQALQVFAREGVERIFCAGDIAGYGSELAASVALLREGNCRCIAGNHDVWYLEERVHSAGDPVFEFMAALPLVLSEEIAGKRLYMVHAAPPHAVEGGIRLLDEEGEPIAEQIGAWSARLADFDHDVLVVAHTHQVFAQRLGHPLVVNPGSTHFNHTCAILALPELEWRVLGLGRAAPVMAWHWGMR